MNNEFDKAFEMYKDDIYRISYSYTLNKHDSEDITQIVFLKLYKNNKVIDSDYIKKWLITVAINECKNHLKSNWMKKVFKNSEDIENVKDLNTDNDLLDALNKIPKKYRVVIHLYYYEGYKLKEIADMLNKSENTIKTWLKRAKESMKIEMED